jgi:hypothetical protein
MMASELLHMTGDASTRYYRRLFLAAAMWNMLAAFSLILLSFNSTFRSEVGFPASPDAICSQLLGSCLFAFGLGYYWLSRDLSRNRDLVTLGVIGKPLVFVVFFGHALARDIPPLMVLPSTVDLLFGVLFLEFLVRTRGKAQ